MINRKLQCLLEPVSGNAENSEWAGMVGVAEEMDGQRGGRVELAGDGWRGLGALGAVMESLSRWDDLRRKELTGACQ